MTILQDVSTNVQGGTNDLSNASEKMKKEVKAVEHISVEVQNRISEVSRGISEVSESVNSINLLAMSVGTVTESLNMEIGQFKTENK